AGRRAVQERREAIRSAAGGARIRAQDGPHAAGASAFGAATGGNRIQGQSFGRLSPGGSMNSNRRGQLRRAAPIMIMVAALAAPMTVPRLAFAKPGDRHPAGDTLPGSKAARAASQEFIDDAAASNRAEIQTAQFVLQRTRNEALKHFAQKIV